MPHTRASLPGALINLINGYSLENESNTPDRILAQYLLDCLRAYNSAVMARAIWYGRMDIPGQESVPIVEGPIDVNWTIKPEAHNYVSTACEHGLHEHCRKVCKFCEADCLCPYCDHSVLEKTDE